MAEPEGGPAPEPSEPAKVESPYSFTASPDTTVSHPPPYPKDTPFNVGVAFSSKPSTDETIAEKMTPAHIDRLLENSDKSNKRSWIDGLAERGQVTVVVLAVLFGVIQLCRWTIDKGQYAVAEKIVTAFIAFVGGYGARGFVDKDKAAKDE